MEKIFKKQDEQAMAECLRKVQASQEQVNCYINEMELKELANAPIMAGVLKQQMGFQASEQRILECMGSNVMLSIPKDGVRKNIPVFPTALPTLSDRAKLFGLTTRLHPIILNEGFKYYSEECSVLLQDGAVIAAHSKEYAYLPQEDLFNILRSGLMTSVGKYEFVSGSYSEELTTALFRLPDAKKKLAALGCEGCTPAVLFTTNDVAKCGANLQAMLVKDGTDLYIRLGSQLTTTHKDKHTVADFGTNVDQVLSILLDGTKKLESLKKISIKYPEQCFMNLVKEYSLPRKEAESAKDDFAIRRKADVSAYDLYWALWNLMAYVKANGASTMKQMDIEENLTRVMNAVWHKFDVDYAV